MSEIERVLKLSGYSEKAIDYYINKKNLYKIENADATFLYNGPCGDTMEFFLEIKDRVITDASFLTIGCVGAHVAGSTLTEMIKSRTLAEAENITEDQILTEIGGLPKDKKDCICLAKRTLIKALKKYKNNDKDCASFHTKNKDVTGL
ncbi:MAG: iron-sulfur cluster assembly scaffold protein [Spirochaetales bacterium]|nr:iron-sulfur cluster assembly scaffold protein [Spirochaetales bacterium]